MDIMTQIKLFTMASGGAMVGGEILSYYLRNYVNKTDKLANGHLSERKEIESLLSTDGLLLAKDIQLKRKFNYEGSVTFGATGAGKTTGFFIPNLLSNDINGSIVVTDPKGELFELTSWYQKNICGRKVLRFSPLEPDISEQYNLLSSCKDNSEVLELASSLLFNGSLSIELATGKKAGGVEWVQMSEPLFASALLYCKTLEYPYNTIEFAFQLLITFNTKQLDSLFMSSKNFDCITQWKIFKMVGGADRTEGSIKISLSSNLKLFTDERINKVSSNTTFDFESFRKEPTILYICYPENKANYISPFTAPFFSKMLDTFINKYSIFSIPITIFADEFANVGMINNMSTNVSTIRSRQISMNICLQSITQLFQVYGEHNAKAILNNLKSKMVYPSLSDERTLNYISTLCGEKEIETLTRSENKNSNGKSFSKTKVKMFPESDLRCLNDDEILIILSNKYPILTNQNTYYINDNYTKNIKPPLKIDKKAINRIDVLDKILDIQIDCELQEEDDYDIKRELFK